MRGVRLTCGISRVDHGLKSPRHLAARPRSVRVDLPEVQDTLVEVLPGGVFSSKMKFRPAEYFLIITILRLLLEAVLMPTSS